jgi:hypothetical protein
MIAWAEHALVDWCRVHYPTARLVIAELPASELIGGFEIRLLLPDNAGGACVRLDTCTLEGYQGSGGELALLSYVRGKLREGMTIATAAAARGAS